MPIKPDLRVHGKELESLLRRVAELEEAQGPVAFASASSASESPDNSGLEASIAALSVRLEDIENQLADVSTMGPKKMAMKFGARMDDFDVRLQAIEAGVKP